MSENHIDPNRRNIVMLGCVLLIFVGTACCSLSGADLAIILAPDNPFTQSIVTILGSLSVVFITGIVTVLIMFTVSGAITLAGIWGLLRNIPTRIDID